MIESSIVNWIDLGDSMQSLEIYGKKTWLRFFNLIKTLLKHYKFSLFFYMLLKFFFFLQIIMLNITNVKSTNDSSDITVSTIISFNSTDNQTTLKSNSTNKIENSDYMIKVLNYVSTSVLFIQEIITNQHQYKFALITNSIITLISIICLIYILISVTKEKFFVQFPVKIFNYINILILEYFIGPSIQISLLTFKCTNGVHDLLGTNCFSDSTHLIYSIFAIFNFIYFTLTSVILAIYFNEIGSITDIKVSLRLNTNFEIYTNFSKVIMFVFAYFLKFYSNDSLAMKIVFEIYMILNFLFLTVFCYKRVLYFNELLNKSILLGWVFVTWFSVVVFLKTLFSINETSVFVVVGWIILSFITIYLIYLKEDYLLTEFKMFEIKSLKDIEWYVIKILNLINYQNLKQKTLLMGIIEKFEETSKNNQEMNEKYMKLKSNKQLKKKYNSDSAVSVLGIIYIIYDHYLEKSNFKIDILFNFCYFLINKLKNASYAAYLCSKIKSNSHKEMFLKYILMEDFKTFMINRLLKSSNKESIKRIQLGSAILFNIYCELYKNKIYEITCNQIDYYDILKNSVFTNKTTEKFLKLGEDVIKQRTEIMRLWQNIIDLNPFNEDIYRDFTLYSREIIQDETLYKNETKKLNSIKSSKFSERNNTYYYLFHPNNSILLVDGHSTFGKVLYYTPNFPALFDFSGKEVLNMTVDDLCPQVIKEFHRDIIFNGIQYTNISVVFNSQRHLLLKGKTGNLHDIKIFIKCIPNLSNGIIYMLDITKVMETYYAILIDKNFRISAFTNYFSQGLNYEEGEGYVLDKSCINSYIFIIIPHLLLNMQYSETDGFYFAKDNHDMKGSFYNLPPHRSLNEKVDRVLNAIKRDGKLIFSDDQVENDNEYEDLVEEIEKNSTSKQSVFYKVIPRFFLGKKFRYYRIQLSTDLITIQDDDETGSPQKTQEKSLVNNNNNVKGKNDIYNFAPKSKKRVGHNKLYSKLNSETLNSNGKFDYLPDNNKANEESNKIIKLKINYNASEEENKKLLEEGEKKMQEKRIGVLENKLNRLQEENSLGSKSNISINSMDSSSFNRLKKGILENKEISPIKYMKLLSVFFGLGMIILVLLSSEESNKKFSNLNSYILQNMFFNHSKIAVSCLYFSVLNIKLIKNKVYNIPSCMNRTCDDFYSDLLEFCVADIKIQKQNSNYFFYDIKNILFSTKEISLKIHNKKEKNIIPINIENNLNLLISYGLNLNSNKDEYINNPDSHLDDMVENILEQSILYINDKSINGLSEAEKENKLNNDFLNPLDSILVVEIISFTILIVFFIIFILKIYVLEKEYLRKIIHFTNVPFDNYVKNLEEIKKRLRNDTTEEEGVKGEYDAINELANFSDMKNTYKKSDGNTKKVEEGQKKSNRKRKKSDDKDDSDDEETSNKNGKKNPKNKNRKKSRDIRIRKFQIMSLYFFKENIFFFLKVIFIIILSASYYLVVNIMDQSTITKMLEFDLTNDSLEGVYTESFMIYLKLKSELAKYIDFELLKQNTAKSFLKKTSNSTLVFFENKPFSSPEALMNSRYYKLNLPSQIESPKIGTLLMPLTNTDLTVAAESIVNLNNLYNYNSCAILYDSENQPIQYSKCSVFWSSILMKGMEQSITQMSVVITSVLDDFQSLNANTKNLTQILQEGSNFDTYEKFVQIYLLDAYMYTVKIFQQLNQFNLDKIFRVYRFILIGYIIFGIILFFFMLYFIYHSKFIFNTFMNFIGILPMIYLLEDLNLYKEILKLEKYL